VVGLCHARLQELRGGSPQVAADRAKDAAPHDSESTTFRKLSQFMERNLGKASSEYQGKNVVHTSAGERVIIWALLALFLAIFITAYFIQS
jgi:type VI protein secretion system component VasF